MLTGRKAVYRTHDVLYAVEEIHADTRPMCKLNYKTTGQQTNESAIICLFSL